MNDFSDIQSAERMAVGSAMLGPDEYDEISVIVRPDDFAYNSLKMVFDAIAALREADRNIDAAAVYLRIQQCGRLAELDADPMGFLVELVEIAGAGANGAAAASAVREAATRRRLAHLFARAVRDASQPGEPAEDLAARYESELQKLADGSATTNGVLHVGTVVRNVLERIDAIATGEEALGVVPTGFAEIDEMLMGGIAPGELAILAARPGQGKSAIALRMADHAAQSGFPTLIFSLEMSARENVQRMLAASAGVSLPAIRSAKISPEQAGKLDAETGPNGLGGRALYFDGRVGQTASMVASTARLFARRHGVKLVVIDYLGLLKPEDRTAPKYLQIGESTKILKNLAMQAGISVLCLCQLNREPEARNDGKPRLSDLRDSGEIEQDADTVFMLHRRDDDPKKPVHPIDFLIVKARSALCGTVELDFIRNLTKFVPRSAEGYR